MDKTNNIGQMVERENLIPVIKGKEFTEDEKNKAFRLYCELAKS